MSKQQKKTTTKQPAKMGRPTVYKESLCQLLIAFFDVPPYINREIPHFDKAGRKDANGNKIVVWTEIKRVTCGLPSLTKFCKAVKIDWVTAHNWIDKESPYFIQDFFNAYMHAKAIRKDNLIDVALTGMVPPNTFKFIAVNLTDMRDRQEVAHDATANFASMIQAARQAKELVDAGLPVLPEQITKRKVTSIVKSTVKRTAAAAARTETAVKKAKKKPPAGQRRGVRGD